MDWTNIVEAMDADAPALKRRLYKKAIMNVYGIYYFLVVVPAKIIAFPIAFGLSLVPLIIGYYCAKFTFYRLIKSTDDRGRREFIAGIFAVITWIYVAMILYVTEYDIYFTLVEVSRHRLG